MRILVSGSTRTVNRLAPHYPSYLGHLLTPANGNSPKSMTATGLPWALDNAAFSGFDAERFVKKLEACVGLPRCLFVVAPDVVCDAKATLAQWEWWALVIRSKGFPAAFVLQDGQDSYDLPDAEAYFIGGSDEWKESRAVAVLGQEVKRRGKHLHMGRVNSLRRLRVALRFGCDSIDGSGYSNYADVYLEKHMKYIAAQLSHQAQQQLLF